MLTVTNGHVAVEVIRNNMAARQNDLRLYLDVIPDPVKVGVNLHNTDFFWLNLHISCSLTLPLNLS